MIPRYPRLPAVLLFLTLSLAVRVHAAPEAPLDASAVDAIVEDAIKAWRVPGASVAVVRGDEVVYLKGFGVRRSGTEERVTPDTVFAIGSTTKAMTAAAVAMLVDDGKMAWDDPVRKHLEYFHLSDPLADGAVTLRDLLCHRTGLSRHDMLWFASPLTREEILRRVAYVKLNRPFRSTWQYQNIAFLAAGTAVEKASGRTWEEFVRARIFEPLGMTGASFSTTDAEKSADHATPHRKKDETVTAIPWRNIDNIGPAGSVNAAARDMAQWVRFQLGDGTFAGKRLLSTANLEEMHTPQMVVRIEGPGKLAAAETETTQVSYGLGWQVQDYRGRLLVSHGGNIDGFTARVALLPRERLGIVVLANLNATAMNSSVSNSITDLVLGLPHKDWNAVYATQTRRSEEREAAARTAREEKRHKDTKPSRELAAYAGEYEDPAYGTARVTLDGEKLVLQWSSFKTPLDHWHFDTFTAKEEPLDDAQVVFALDGDGDVATMSVLGADFKRKK
jgi:CubicO group peptidase (beta-lactamase class C family)